VADRETELIEALCRERDRANRNYRLNEAYYEGQNRLRSRGLAIPPQMEQLALVVNWARVVVHELDNRLDLRGFRVASDPELESRLWGWWKSADMEDETSPAHVEALVQGRAYIVVGPHPDDPSVPIWTIETGRCMHASIDPVTRDPVAAVRVYDYDDRGVPQRAALYLPYETRYYGRSDRSGGTWLRDSVYRHGVPSPLVAPMINRARVADRYGRSEMDDIKPLMGAACRTLMNLAGAQELMAVPQRWALGVSAEDFLDSEGNPIPVWEAYLGRIWALRTKTPRSVSLPRRTCGISPRSWSTTCDRRLWCPVCRHTISGSPQRIRRARRRSRPANPAWSKTLSGNRLCLAVRGGARRAWR